MRTPLDKLIRDKHGRIVIWQFPNVPLWGWLACRVAVYFTDAGRLETALGLLGTAFLLAWAYLEITQGVSTIRRLAGVLAFLGIVASCIW